MLCISRGIRLFLISKLEKSLYIIHTIVLVVMCMIVNVYDLGEIGTKEWRKRLHDQIARIAYEICIGWKRQVFYIGGGKIEFSGVMDARTHCIDLTGIVGEIWGLPIRTRWYFIRKAWKEGRYMDIIERIEKEIEKEKTKVVA